MLKTLPFNHSIMSQENFHDWPPSAPLDNEYQVAMQQFSEHLSKLVLELVSEKTSKKVSQLISIPSHREVEIYTTKDGAPFIDVTVHLPKKHSVDHEIYVVNTTIPYSLNPDITAYAINTYNSGDPLGKLDLEHIANGLVIQFLDYSYEDTITNHLFETDDDLKTLEGKKRQKAMQSIKNRMRSGLRALHEHILNQDFKVEQPM